VVKERRRARPEDLVAGERQKLEAEGVRVVREDPTMERAESAEDYFDEPVGKGARGVEGAEEFSEDDDILLGAEEMDEE
jgi:hypothetical protein